MAPQHSAAPKGQRAGQHLARIGVEGRKTGLTVPELPRDQYGMEEVSGLFSSPQKGQTPARRAGAYDSDSESMAITNNTSNNASSVIRAQRRGTTFLPASRSPVKTSLGSSPRRSQGDAPSPRVQRKSSKSSRASLNSAPRRSLAYDGANVNAARMPKSPGLQASPQRRIGDARANPRARRQTYDLLDDEEEEEEGEEDEEEDTGAAEEPADQEDDEEVEEDINGHAEAGHDVPDSEGTPIGGAEDDDQIPNGDVVDTGLDDALDVSGIDEDAEGTTNHASMQSTSSKRGRKRKSGELSTSAAGNEKPAKKRGRPPKNRAAASEEDPGSEPPVTRSPLQAATTKPATKKIGPAHRNPKARISSTKSRRADDEPSTAKSRKRDHQATVPSDAKSKPKAKPPPAPREEKPDEHKEIIPVVLRSGRTSVKPLDYWRGEQIVYEPPKRVGKILLPGGYQGIDPGRRNAEQKRAYTKRGYGRGRTTSKEPDSTRDPKEVEDDDEEESWETEGPQPGILAAEVPLWDPEAKECKDDEFEELPLAFSFKALERILKPDKNRTFKFGKTLTLPFFHSGVVEMDPGGEKRPKDSRWNHMIFWVFSGRVQVDLNGTQFSIGRGGMWQVPRGHYYGLSNPFKQKTRIFFAQANYMEQPEDEDALRAQVKNALQ